MAFAMAFTMMAGAAYTDQADITATEAVDTLAALNVMTGDPNGSFRPNDSITRAEACRMIYTIRNGGKEDADAYKGMQTTFTDVPADAWYAGYVKHCQSVGIVSGKSATTFDPNAKVTGVELALMCLRVMGYDPAKVDIGGSTWSIKTIGLATEAGLLDDVKTAVEAACPRQWAAQIMFNMIGADTVKWSKDAEEYISNPDYTVGEKYMDLIDDEGIVVAVGHNTKGYTAKIQTGIDSEKKPVIVTLTSLSFDPTNLVGKAVKAMYKETDEVYGIFVDKDNTMIDVTTSVGDLDNNKTVLKVDGVEYDLDAAKVGEVKVVYAQVLLKRCLRPPFLL